jgi:hypothetical protein
LAGLAKGGLWMEKFSPRIRADDTISLANFG